MKNVGDKQNEIKNSLRERIHKLAQQMQLLEKVGVLQPDPVFVVAMETGAATVMEHVEKRIPQTLAVRVNDDISCWTSVVNSK